mmetsp:Transcript_2373/g.6346  ORF Transcript_2373/g.6346 Transcript_2373/m.6346 type:complete len:84 (-) Transcript_2373:13-264(-)
MSEELDVDVDVDADVDADADDDADDDVIATHIEGSQFAESVSSESSLIVGDPLSDGTAVIPRNCLLLYRHAHARFFIIWVVFV